MEYFLKLKQDSRVHCLLEDIVQNRKDFIKFTNDFSKKHGIEGNSFYTCCQLGITNLTENDISKFKQQIKKDGVWFKKSSELWKDYFNSYKELGFNNKDFQVNAWDLGMQLLGSHKMRKFKRKNFWYVKIEAEQKVEVPADFEQIKASEYYKILEEMEREVNG